MTVVPIVFTIDKTFLPPTYVAIASLVNHAKQSTKYEIIILYQGKVDKRVQTLFEIVKGSRHKMIIRDISSIKMNVPKTTKYWPSIVYVRLYLPSILKEYDKIIFSDVDVFFRGDLAEVFSVDISENEWGGVAAEVNNSDSVIHQYYVDNKHSFIFWAGFMVMNLNYMREKKWEERCNINLEKYKNKLFMCDLEILNLTAENIKRLPLRYVYLQALYDASDITQTREYVWLSRLYSKEELEIEKKKAVIIHYAGKVGKIGKIWLRMNPAEYYNKYLRMLPPTIKRQNNIMKYYANGKVLVKTILEMLHITSKR